MGLSDPVRKRIYKEWGEAKSGEFVTIVGVLKDFHFASRILISGVLFLPTALYLMTAALMSVAFRAIKAASVNPAESLKYE